MINQIDAGLVSGDALRVESGWRIVDGCNPVEDQERSLPLYTNDLNFMGKILPNLRHQGVISTEKLDFAPEVLGHRIKLFKTAIPVASRFGLLQSEIIRYVADGTEKLLELPLQATVSLPSIGEWAMIFYYEMTHRQ